MAKWVASSVLDNGLNQIKNNATRMLLLNTYSAGQSYATITGGSNVLASVVMKGTDFTLTDGAASSRALITTAKSTTAVAASSTPDLHIAFTNGSNTVYWVTDESTNQAIGVGNTVNFPAITYTSSQPS